MNTHIVKLESFQWWWKMSCSGLGRYLCPLAESSAAPSHERLHVQYWKKKVNFSYAC